MKNEEWELLFLLVKREKGKGKNRADGIQKAIIEQTNHSR